MSDTFPTPLASREAREAVAQQMAYQHITDHPDPWVDMSEQRRDGWRARAQSVIDALLASGVVADAVTAARADERERLRRHMLLTDENLRDLHENAKAYSLANAALREKYGYTHSTTLAFLIEQGYLVPRKDDTAARAEGDALRARIEALTYASDDGSEYEHNDDCQGEAECPACWAQTIRAALTSGDQS